MTLTTEDRDEHALYVARTIRQQISYDGPLGMLARIAARNFQALPPSDDSQGGLRFRCSIRKPKTQHWIEITLRWSDTYRVRMIRKKRGMSPLETLIDTEGECDVYCDQLKDCVETFAEEHA